MVWVFMYCMLDAKTHYYMRSVVQCRCGDIGSEILTSRKYQISKMKGSAK